MKINSEKILFTQLGNEGVIYDSEDNRHFALNETFIRILHSIEEGYDQEAIVKSLCEQYNISETVCKSEVQKALEILVEKRYVIY